MHPCRELTRLAARKSVLLYRIALQRDECAAAARRLVRPVATLDRCVAGWRRLPAFVRLASVPLLLLASRLVLPRASPRVRSLLRWLTLVGGGVRVIRAAYRARS